MKRLSMHASMNVAFANNGVRPVSLRPEHIRNDVADTAEDLVAGTSYLSSASREKFALVASGVIMKTLAKIR